LGVGAAARGSTIVDAAAAGGVVMTSARPRRGRTGASRVVCWPGRRAGPRPALVPGDRRSRSAFGKHAASAAVRPTALAAGGARPGYRVVAATRTTSSCRSTSDRSTAGPRRAYHPCAVRTPTPSARSWST